MVLSFLLFITMDIPVEIKLVKGCQHRYLSKQALESFTTGLPGVAEGEAWNPEPFSPTNLEKNHFF